MLPSITNSANYVLCNVSLPLDDTGTWYIFINITINVIINT